MTDSKRNYQGDAFFLFTNCHHRPVFFYGTGLLEEGFIDIRTRLVFPLMSLCDGGKRCS